MLYVCKIGTTHPEAPDTGWRDGQIVNVYPSDTVFSQHMRKHFLIIEDGRDYWKVRGDTEWKSTKPAFYEFKKMLSAADSNGKHRWEFGYDERTVVRKRDVFVDPKALLDAGLISAGFFADNYNKDYANEVLTLQQDPTTWLLSENDHTRKTSLYSDVRGSVASGTYSIGSGLDYTDVSDFEADIAATLTGNLTGEINAEEISESTAITFDPDTDSYLLKLTAQSGDEHNGGAYGNGARISFTSYDLLKLSGTAIDDVEISNIAFDVSGANNWAIRFDDGADTGNFLGNRLLVKGDADSNGGLYVYQNAINVDVRNCIVYGCSGGNSIRIDTSQYVAVTWNIVNNTLIGGDSNIFQDDAGPQHGSTTLNIKNNLCQDPQTADFVDDGAGFGTTSKNVSEDATSPDTSYRSKDVHTNSVFQDYANDDFRLDSGGDSTNLQVLDDGDDLSGTFTDDIQGQTRSTWYIGASEIVSAGRTTKNTDPYPLGMNSGISLRMPSI